MFTDSLDKIIFTYFRAVAAEPFTFRGTTIEPQPLQVSPGIFRGYTCPSGCGGCCMKFSLVYLPEDVEEHPYQLTHQWVDFNGKQVEICVDEQGDNTSRWCRNLRHEDGRCGVHGKHPFTCDFELLRFTMFSGKAALTTRLFGRGWSYQRVDGGKGAKCEIVEVSQDSTQDAARKLRRLQQWTEHFGLRTVLPTVIAWVESGPHDLPLKINPKRDGILRHVR